MTDYQFDFNIPVPPRAMPTRLRPHFLDDMPVGASKFLPWLPDGKNLSSKITSRKKQRIEFKGRVFTTRRRKEGGVDGVRVWRLE